MRVGAGLKVVIVTAWGLRCVKVTRWTWRIVAWAAVVKLARGARPLSLTWLTIAVTRWTIAVAWRAITKLGAFAIACGTITHAVTAHMAAGARCTTL
jgi:hypothetical protein